MEARLVFPPLWAQAIANNAIISQVTSVWNGCKFDQKSPSECTGGVEPLLVKSIWLLVRLWTPSIEGCQVCALIGEVRIKGMNTKKP
jgi:hypothetical protein